MLYALLIVSMLCRAHRGRPAALRHAGLAGMVLALGMAIGTLGMERGIAAWLAGVLAGGALAPMILLVLALVLARADRRLPQTRPGWLRRLLATAK